MRNQTIKTIAIFAAALSLTACGFFDKDNTPVPQPLNNFQPEITPHLAWYARTVTGTDDEYLKMSPAVGDTAIFVAGAKGTVTSVAKSNGNINWSMNTAVAILAGPAVGDGIVVVGSRRGEIVALSQDSGLTLWKANVPGEILAQPAVGHGYVIVKAVDGVVRGLSTKDGHELWSYQQTEPALILRAASRPLIRDNNLIVGFANGNLTKLTLRDGQLLWNRPIAVPQGAFAIQRMIDIDADPLVFEHHIYAATYQGTISKIDWSTGNQLWTHDISSYTGMAADPNSIYISDARGFLWAFSDNSGLVNWRQTDLEARVLSGPASMGNYVVVGDAEGYLHWLAKSDGHFAGRAKPGSAIYAAPVVENNVLYALAKNGNLFAYTLN